MRTLRITGLLAPGVILIPVMAVFYSCSSHTTEDAIIEAMDESIQLSNSMLSTEIDGLYAAFEDKKTNAGLSRLAMRWSSKVDSIRHFSENMKFYIDGIISKFRNDENNISQTRKFFIIDGHGELLYQRLLKYKSDILAIDERIKANFSKSLLLTTGTFESDENKNKNFSTTYFANTSIAAVLATLHKLKNNVLNAEYRLVSFCNEQCTLSCNLFSYMQSAIVSQSSSCVGPGDSIVIMAGLGDFSMEKPMKMKVAGREITEHENGLYKAKIKAPGKAGSYSTMVQLTYIDHEGREQIRETLVDYKVVAIDKSQN